MDVITTLLQMAGEEESVIRKTAIMDAVNAVEKQREYPGRRTFKCPVCGADVLLTDVFCRHCGQRLPSSSTTFLQSHAEPERRKKDTGSGASCTNSGRSDPGGRNRNDGEDDDRYPNAAEHDGADQ